MGLTDTITFTCTACGHVADYPKAQEGKAIYCPKCHAAQVVGRGTDRFRAERIPTGRIARAEAAPSTDRIERPHGMAGTARIDFTCGACNHSSRISAALAGQPVRCPSCGTVQLAGVAGLRVVRLDASGKLPFTCTACSFQARLNPDYAGKAIRCPKCQGAQVVPRVLRESTSGAHQALPSGASVVRTEPGTGQIRREPGTGSLRAVRSEPSAALRTPAGGIPVAQPMPTPTPLPGSLATPPPGSLGAAPEPQSAASAPGLPLVPPDAGDDQLDLGDAPASAAPADPARPQRGGVVRRSGRMAAHRTPQPSNEPTLEPARAVQAEPDLEAPAAPVPAPAVHAPPPPTSAVRPATASVARPSAPVVAGRSTLAWMLPVLGVLAAVGLIAAAVLTLKLGAAGDDLAGLREQLAAERQATTAAQADAESERARVVEAEAARVLIAQERDELRTRVEALTAERDEAAATAERHATALEAARAEIEQLKKPAQE